MKFMAIAFLLSLVMGIILGEVREDFPVTECTLCLSIFIATGRIIELLEEITKKKKGK